MPPAAASWPPITPARTVIRGGDPRVPSRAGGAGGQPADGLVGTTGSARELLGAYLGTAHDTTRSRPTRPARRTTTRGGHDLRIGGQDSKYILLRNGVPIDYAMNNACPPARGRSSRRAPTGILGIGVADIAAIALDAPAPVRFKTTCAAFINSDIRIAQQQGHSREDIVAGLVYSIAGNYLNRVKGPRAVGARVFLQGGVALNARSATRSPTVSVVPSSSRRTPSCSARSGRPPGYPARPEGPGSRPILSLGAPEMTSRGISRAAPARCLRHRPLRGGRPAFPFRRPVQPLRARVEARRPHRAAPTWSSGAPIWSCDTQTAAAGPKCRPPRAAFPGRAAGRRLDELPEERPVVLEDSLRGPSPPPGCPGGSASRAP